MSASKNFQTPMCSKCQEPMLWVSEQIVLEKAVQVFHCETCDKYAAATADSNGVEAPTMLRSRHE